MRTSRHEVFVKRPPSRPHVPRPRRAPRGGSLALEDLEDREDLEDLEEWEDDPEPGSEFEDLASDDEDAYEDEDAYDDDPDRRPTRRWMAAVGVVALLVAVAAVGVRALGRDSPTEASEVSARTIAFRPPVTVPPDTEHVQARVLGSGDVRVDHWIRSGPLLFDLTVAVPAVAGVDRGDVAVRRFEVDADGVRLTVPATLEGQGYRFSFVGSHRVHVSYVLHGATELAGPGGRALARMTALDVGYDPVATTRTLTFVGATVLSLACSTPQGTPTPCGQESAGEWSIALGGATEGQQVMAQVELPPGAGDS